MFFFQTTANFILFLIGVLGIALNKQNVLIILMCIELILLSANLNFTFSSIYLDDLYGQIFSLFILTIAACESAIGLAILILYYRLRGNISINFLPLLKG
jgi:NADH:ubiquinone oxidoreductase subunit K